MLNSEKMIASIEKQDLHHADKYLKKALNDYLYKTAKEYNCDIDGFGKYAVKYFPTIKDWQDYNWLDNFQNSTFNVNVETTIKSGNTFL